MKIFIKSLKGVTIAYEIKETDTVKILKHRIYVKEGIEPE